MSDNRKYYYLKLKENYFDDDSIVLLESMQDGVLYSNILLKLYLKSLKHGGRLQLDEDIPYTAQMIATITRQQIGTVERALQIFLKLGLVEVLESGTFYMSNIELLIGQSSTEAERKRAARLQNKALSALRTSGGHLSGIRPPEIEIELEKEIEIKREIEKVRPETGHPSHTYGRYQNVFLTDGQKSLVAGYFREPYTITPDVTVKEGDELSIAGFTWKVFETPGHTIGSCCYYIEKESVLFSGDTLFAGSYGRTDFPTGSGRQIAESVRRLLSTLPDDTMVYPGHMDTTTIGFEKKYNPLSGAMG